ncbi:MAG TPA: hypothetical protein VEK79_10620 [Thermoanaerobaculia bacterium]|nr:hypothetical protein [Thermoanaerobaculia bacterium]
MKRAIVSIVVLVLALALALGGCRNSEQKAGDEATQTIAPAKPQPDLTGSDAMTQTVDVEKGRAENEGHGTEAAGTATTATTTTSGTVAPTTST